LGKNVLAQMGKSYCVKYVKLVLWLQNVFMCVRKIPEKSALTVHETKEAKTAA
jgi:hypothetical protein